MRNMWPFIEPCPSVRITPKRDFISLTTLVDSIPAGALIEVITRQLRFLHGLRGLFADACERKPRRNHRGLLRSADHNVDAPFVRAQIGGAQAGDRIHDEAAIRQPAYNLAERLDVVSHAGRAFRRLNEYDAKRPF